MAYVPVPKDLSKVKTKVAFNLTKRQLICFAAALGAGLPLFFLLKGSAGTSLAAMAMIVVMLPCFLFTLKFTCIKWYATCCLWPDSHCVIDIIRSESGFLNFLHGKVPGKLMYNSGYHFQMTEFFCSYVVEQSRSRPVRHGKTLGKITQGSANLTVRATGVQYPIIVPQP